MVTPEPVVSVRGLTKTYDKHRAVDDVSFELHRGETLALLGPNGAGKSTTIEILEGYRNRTSGTVSVLGTDPARATLAWKARLGIVLQTSGESGLATVREMVSHFARFYQHPRSVDETIAAVGLTEHAGKRIKSLSGGQRRRVDVALGIVGRPELLFLDEPTTGFDPAARREFWGLIRCLKSEGTSILLTTHYLDEAARLGDRAAIITGGRLVEDAPISQIGGAEAQTPIVRWEDAAGPREQRTETPGTLVADLTARLGEPDALEIVRPSLEDIYLDIVAQPDAQAESGTDGRADAHRGSHAESHTDARTDRTQQEAHA